MPSTPAMTTGMIFLMTSPGFITPIEAIPTPDLAVPYAAPMSKIHGEIHGRCKKMRAHRCQSHSEGEVNAYKIDKN